MPTGLRPVLNVQQRRSRGATLEGLGGAVPVPVMMKAMSLSADQPLRLTISCTIAERSGVRWARPASPTVVHAAGDQATEAEVRSRAPMLFDPEAKVTALSEATPWTMTLVAVLLLSSVWNWIQALRICAPGRDREAREAHSDRLHVGSVSHELEVAAVEVHR